MVALPFSKRIQSATALPPVLLRQRSIDTLASLCSTTEPLLQYTAGRASALAPDNLNYTTRTS